MDMIEINENEFYKQSEDLSIKIAGLLDGVDAILALYSLIQVTNACFKEFEEMQLQSLKEQND